MIFVPHPRARINILGVCTSLILPWLLFVALFWVMSFELHYQNPTFAYGCLLGGFASSIVSAIICQNRKMRDADPAWYSFAAVAFLLSTILAWILGDLVFWNYMNRYYDYRELNSYSGVDPVKYRSQQMMDAGKVYWADGTILDTGRSMGFKAGNMYCVAPITKCNSKRIEFWAVGIDCCTAPNHYHCGDWKNPRTRSSVRILDMDDRPFYQLAVQQAEAAYGITSPHPIFFEWTQDPVEKVEGLLHKGWRFFFMGCLAYFVFNFTIVCSHTFAFGKLGRTGNRGNY